MDMVIAIILVSFLVILKLAFWYGVVMMVSYLWRTEVCQQKPNIRKYNRRTKRWEDG